ncbi:cation:proton antiporter [Pedobacter chitinilyticus]|uniref:Sodium:proton antiporter n=1 Tax=Pedobacter chitinilyticus TaxID=2233776 RepID=A0A443Z0G6_9SPHI|nr:cation:proton antiporter [Pedobacter chitinilyticus]RWU10022.1 sodium:proton antiporter [Pedobacter chitinilyticus]
MTTYTILIVLSALVIFSYLFDLVASKTKLPSVLLLLVLGIGLRILVDKLQIHTYNFLDILPTLGTVGLILIVFEGSLELKYAREKNKVIKGAFLSALLILIATVVVITFIIYQITGQTLYLCFVNAIPFSVISSAIAIPSVSSINKKSKEFIIYESSFSDILGIILFNFAVANQHITVGSFGQLALNTVLILLLSVVACVTLLYLMGRLRHHIKFFLIISILIMVYAIGQSFHLSALVLILSFGLFLNNADAIKHAWFRSIFIYKNLSNDLTQLHQLSAETAFIIRTFFFVIFGFTMNIYELDNFNIIANGLIMLGSIYVIRFGYLYFFKREHVLPEGFVTPRGLISILLYYNLPQHMKLVEIGTPFLFMVVLGSSLVMSIGLMSTRKKQTAQTEAGH